MNCPFCNKPEYLFDININNILYQIDRVKSFYVDFGRNDTLNEYASRALKVRISSLKRRLTLLGYRNEVFLPFNTDLANLAYVYDCLSQLHYYKLKRKTNLSGSEIPLRYKYFEFRFICVLLILVCENR